MLFCILLCAGALWGADSGNMTAKAVGILDFGYAAGNKNGSVYLAKRVVTYRFRTIGNAITIWGKLGTHKGFFVG